jgi:hypothetical protein
LKRAKIGEEPRSDLKIFIIVNRNVATQSTGMEIAMFLPIAAGQFSLLFYWLMKGIRHFPIGFPILYKNCPEAFH